MKDGLFQVRVSDSIPDYTRYDPIDARQIKQTALVTDGLGGFEPEFDNDVNALEWERQTNVKKRRKLSFKRDTWKWRAGQDDTGRRYVSVIELKIVAHTRGRPQH